MVFMDLWLTVWVGAAEEADGDLLSDQQNLYYSGVFIGASFGYTFFVWAGSLMYVGYVGHFFLPLLFVSFARFFHKSCS